MREEIIRLRDEVLPETTENLMERLHNERSRFTKNRRTTESPARIYEK